MTDRRHAGGGAAGRAVAPTVRGAVLLLALVLAAHPSARPHGDGPGSIPSRSDEFVGPFPSWSSARIVYGAVGDGTSDDTAAIQAGLDALGSTGHSPVLFLPKGVYRITRTLTLRNTINVSVVGEDPATTRLEWDGPPGGTMLAVNGVAYSRFVRLTFDGRRTAAVAVEQSWDGSRPHFDTGNEYADNEFVDVEYGIRGGFEDFGFAETSVVRSRFVRNTRAGIALGNFNALDLWVWYSTFEDCRVGVTNETGAGNYRVYNSVFRRSTASDLSMGNTGGFSARGNYSVGSRAFFVSAGTTANPATVHLQGNTIVDPGEATVIRIGNQGPALIVDNVFGSPPAATGPAIEWSAFFGADVVSIGNTFTVADPIRNNGRLVSVDDRTSEHGGIRAVEPALPGPLPNLRRRIFEVPPGSDGTAIQSAIDEAAAYRATRPVVHVPDGVYEVTRTLTIPPGDLQIVGDGYGTVLRWAGAGRGPVARLMGPSQATLREIHIDGGGRADGLVVEGADQVGSRVYLQQVQLRVSREGDLLVDRLDHTHVHLEDLGHAYSPGGAGVRVRGGPLADAGRPAAGRTSVYSGASSGNRISYDVSAGAKVLVRDLWYEGGAGPGFARVHGRARFTADGLRVSSPVNEAVPAFDIVDLEGSVAILGSHLDDRVTVSGSGTAANVLVLGLFCEQRAADCFLPSDPPPGDVRMLASRQKSGVPGTRSVRAADVGQDDPSFIRTMVSHARGDRPAVIEALPAGVTDVRMFRVQVANGVINLVVRAQ